MTQDIYRYFSRKECLKGREVANPLTPEMETNLVHTLTFLNTIREAYGKPMTITSLYRPAAANTNAGGAKKSAHLTCEAVDIADPDGSLMEWVLSNLQLMKDLKVHMEDFRWTPNWIHFGSRKPSSGKRIFIPNLDPAPAPNRWDGKYDKSFDS